MFTHMTVILPVELRTKEKSANKVKSAEHISAVVYGPKFPTTPIRLNRSEFEKTFKTAGESTIIELQGLKSPVEVLVKEVVFAPIKGGIIHVDFYALEMGKEMTTDVPLHFVNESPAEKNGAVISKVMYEVEITCKPSDLPAFLDVDLSLLVNAEDKIHVSDIVCPKGVKIVQDANDVVALAEMIAEEVEPEVAPVAAADVPVEKKGKTEEEAAE
jgi:large subunit ribosomal protein L25